MNKPKLCWDGKVSLHSDFARYLRDSSKLPKAEEYARQMIKETYKSFPSEKRRELFLHPVYLPEYDRFVLHGVVMSLIGTPPRFVQFVPVETYYNWRVGYRYRSYDLDYLRSVVRNSKFSDNASSLFALMRKEIPFSEFPKGCEP